MLSRVFLWLFYLFISTLALQENSSDFDCGYEILLGTYFILNFIYFSENKFNVIYSSFNCKNTSEVFTSKFLNSENLIKIALAVTFFVLIVKLLQID